MLSNNKCILVYRLPKGEVNSLKEHGFKIIEISEEMVEMTIADILEGLRFETVNINTPKETAIIFNDFSDEEIKLTIKNIRQRFKDGIFATVTPTSIKWKVSRLLQHLIEEREWYLKKQEGESLSE